MQEEASGYLPLVLPDGCGSERRRKKPGSISGQVTSRKGNEVNRCFPCRKELRRYQNRGLLEDSGTNSGETCSRGTWVPSVSMQTEQQQVDGTISARVRMRHQGADYLVRAMKRSNVRRAKRIGDSRRDRNGPTGNRRSPLVSADGGSSREWHEPCDGRPSSTDL